MAEHPCIAGLLDELQLNWFGLVRWFDAQRSHAQVR